MARTFSGKSGDTFVRQSVVTVVPATTSTHTIDIPPGFYNIAAFVRADVTGTTTTFGLHQFTDQAQSVICTAPVTVIELDDSTVQTSGLAVVTGGGAATEQVFIYLGAAILGAARGVPILNGCQLAIEDGTGVENELLDITLVFQRV